MRTLLLLLVTIHVASFVPFVASAATLLVSGGRLMGATDVDVGGNLYDVAFVSEVGSPCVDLYTGCDSEADFDFQTGRRPLSLPMRCWTRSSSTAPTAYSIPTPP